MIYKRADARLTSSLQRVSLCFKMAESFEKLDNILLSKSRNKVYERISVVAFYCFVVFEGLVNTYILSDH